MIQFILSLISLSISSLFSLFQLICIVQMAYAALVSLAQTLDLFLIRHSFVVHDEKQQIQSLHEKIVFLSTFLEDFSREATKLEAPITVAANQVEDFFELHISNLIDSPQDSLVAGHNFTKLYKELQKPTTEINSIMEQVMEIKSRCTSENEMMSTHSSASFSSTPAPYIKGAVVGFEKDLSEIQDQIHGESAKLEVIPIVGMGGIGKTTLARYVLHHPLTLHRFDVSGLITVSQNYDKASILLSLLNSIDPSTKLKHFEKDSLDLGVRVHKYLTGRRFLIVVDDIWKSEPWDDLRRVFPDNDNGSRVIITTRDAHVASYVNSSIHPYEMHLMGVDLSWNLLRQKVFEEEQCPPELEEIGRQIAEKCRGLPLAIVVIAGILSKVDRMQETWEKMAINVNEAVNTCNESFVEIISLSYKCLPHHLRPCFLYMGSFPEDYEMHVSGLIKLWVAEGFLKSNESKDLEEVAEDYLEDLAKRNLVLIIKKRYDGRIKSIKMHDLLRDLCLRKAHDENFLHVIHKCSGNLLHIEKSRRISFLSNVKDPFLNMDCSPLHTILGFDKLEFGSWKHCRLLRVMCLMIEDLNHKICELLHLRYLATTFEDNGIPNFLNVPEHFSKLVNLQTLIIRHSHTLYLPLGIWRMRELRHVIVYDGLLPDPSAETCDHIPPLQNLHTLKRIRNFSCSKRILELIPNLKKLGIFYDRVFYRVDNLVHLQKLEKLNITKPSLGFFNGAISKGLAFPVTLKKLTLERTEIPWKDMSIIGSLPNLQVLKLNWCASYGSVWETVEGQFCQLKVLVIEMADPEVWITESCHFPRLERLTLCGCVMLREIPRDIGDIATLQLIEVISCTPSIVESAKCIEEEQRDYGNDLFQLHLKDGKQVPPVPWKKNRV